MSLLRASMVQGSNRSLSHPYPSGRRQDSIRGSFLCFLCSLLLVFSSACLGADQKPVSYYQDLVPIFKRSCTGCHHPGKLKAELDLTTYRSEERRVGKECRSRWSPYDLKKM